MKNYFASLFVLVLLAVSFSAFSPIAKPFAGKITYNIKVTGNVPAEMQSMLPQKAMYQISDNFVRIDFEPSMPGAGAIITDYDKNTMRMLLDLPGAKFQLVMDDELKEVENNIKDIKYTNETRTIAGYTTKRAIMTNNSDEQSDVWYTDKIEVKGQEKRWGKLKGFPMEFSMTNQGITMLYSASKVEEGKVSKKDFEISNEYKPATQEQLMELFGGME